MIHLSQKYLSWLVTFVTLMAGIGGASIIIGRTQAMPASLSTSEAGFDDPATFAQDENLSESLWWRDWIRPEGPYRVALQVGHWEAENAPEELYQIRTNGAFAVGIHEADLNMRIAQEAKRLLAKADPDIVVDILPATIPPDYLADVLIAIHADKNTDTSVRGYKVAAPWRDMTREAQAFADILSSTYGEMTGLPRDHMITENMRGYYAFNFRKYRHSMHPMTVGVILETGFLSSPQDRTVIVDAPEIPAQAIVTAVMHWLARPDTI